MIHLKASCSALARALPFALALALTACGGGNSDEATGAASNGATAESSTAAAIAPRITQQPEDAAVGAGSSATFSVTARGSAPLRYQWFADGHLIAGARSASYTTPATQLADSGRHYKVRVINAAGKATSRAATLTVAVVDPPPPVDASRCAPYGQLRAGDRIEVTYAYPGGLPASRRTTQTSTVEANVEFQGYRLTAITTEARDSGGSDGATTSRTFFQYDAATARVTLFGTTLDYATEFFGQTIQTDIASVFVPPAVNGMYALSPGGASTQKPGNVLTLTARTVNGSTAPPEQGVAASSKTTVRFLGIETVTVPAGRFSTCHFLTRTTDADGSTQVRANWALAGYGIDVKTSTAEATAIVVNGVRIRRDP